MLSLGYYYACKHGDDDSSDSAWWHAASLPTAAQPGAGNARLLVGGSRRRVAPPPATLDACQSCGGTGSLRCTGCRMVAYCSPKCQKQHWVEGHKHSCKKLRKQQQRQREAGPEPGVQPELLELEAAAAAAPSSPCSHDSSKPTTDGGSSSPGSAGRPDESNSIPPVPKQVG